MKVLYLEWYPDYSEFFIIFFHPFLLVLSLTS